MYVLQNELDEYFYDFVGGCVVVKRHISRAATFKSVTRAMEAVENYSLDGFDIVDIGEDTTYDKIDD